jgi:hypothetical protein
MFQVLNVGSHRTFNKKDMAKARRVVIYPQNGPYYRYKIIN